MGDFERSMQLLAERGTTIGPEALIERLERELAGERQIVVGRSRTARDGLGHRSMSFSRGVVTAAVVFLAVIATGVLLYLFGTGGQEVVDTTILPSTTLPSTTLPIDPTPNLDGQADVELLQAAFDAWYGNDAGRLEEVAVVADPEGEVPWTDDEIRQRMAYDAVVGSRPSDLECTPPEISGEAFECTVVFGNEFTDALGLTDSELVERVSAQVIDGRLVTRSYHDHQFLAESFRLYFAVEARLASYDGCIEMSLTVECAQLQVDHLQDWVAFQDTPAEDLGGAVIETWSSGCLMTFSTDLSTQLASCRAASEYETAMGGELAVSSCVFDDSSFLKYFTCDGSYSNVLNRAVRVGAVSVPVTVELKRDRGVLWESASIVSPYPQDGELLLSVRRWAVDQGVTSQVDEACGLRMDKTPACATFLLDNLDAWAAWHIANN